jgi:hypothetical protein
MLKKEVGWEGVDFRVIWLRMETSVRVRGFNKMMGIF